MSYKDRLLEAMRARGVARKALAAKLGVSESAISQVLSGKTKMLDARNHSLACEYLHCNPMWLADGVGAMSTWQADQQPLTVGAALAVILDAQRRLPRTARAALADDWAALLAAPDSDELRRAVGMAIGAEPETGKPRRAA